MKKTKITVAVLCATMMFSGCGLSNSVKGGGIGAAAGALIGAGIGRVAGNTGVGAAIGGVVGGAAGALIGHKMDKQKKELEKSVQGAKIESVNEGQAIKVTFDSGILFQTNSYALSSQSKTALTNFANNLKTNKDTNIQIIGYTDNTGNDNINVPLSQNRAKSVYDFLFSKGVSTSRMVFEGKGSDNPVADNSTASGRKENRRVEVYILPSQKMIEEAQNGTLK